MCRALPFIVAATLMLAGLLFSMYARYYINEQETALRDTVCINHLEYGIKHGKHIAIKTVIGYQVKCNY